HDDYRFGYAAFRPKRISPEELSELGYQARVRHNTVFQILRRATDFKTNAKDLWSLFTFFAYNPIFRVEFHKKYEMLLGYRGLERETSKSRSSRGDEAPLLRISSPANGRSQSLLTSAATGSVELE